MLQMLCKLFKDLYRSTKYHPVGKLVPIPQERTYLHGLTNLFKDVLNYKPGQVT